MSVLGWLAESLFLLEAASTANSAGNSLSTEWKPGKKRQLLSLEFVKNIIILQKKLALIKTFWKKNYKKELRIASRIKTTSHGRQLAVILKLKLNVLNL